MEFIEDSLQFSTRKVSAEGDNQPVEEEGGSPAGHFEKLMEEASEAKMTDGTIGEVETTGEAETAGNYQTRKQYTSLEGYTKEVKVLRELRDEEEEKEKV
ncbi:hypothetical protein SLA2020_218960 [Shorea laevis]